MFLTIVFLVFIAAFISVTNYKKHLSYALGLYFTGIALLFLGGVLYVIKFSNYFPSVNFDVQMYNIITKLNFSVNDSARIINIGTALFMFGSVYVLNIISEKRNRTKNILLILPVFLFLFFYDPTTSYKIYLAVNDNTVFMSDILNKAIPKINILTELIFVLYMIFPIISLYRYYKNSKIYILLINALLSGICVLLIDIYVYMFFIKSVFSVFMPWNVDLNKFYTAFFDKGYSGLVLPFTLLLALGVTYVVLQRKPFKSVKFLKQFNKQRTINEISHDLRMIFHANKNSFLAIEKLSRQLREYVDTDSETAKEIAMDIEEMSNSGLETLTHSLSLLDPIPKKDTEIDLCQCIRNTVTRISLPQNIKLSINFEAEPVIISASEFHISESLLNIIHNAVDAIGEADRKMGEIQISLHSENGYTCIEIRDNGCGISKKNIRDIFSILYSTKHNSTKWGIGLTYVQQVVNAYDGIIHVKSKLGEYSCFQIVLPLFTQKSIKKEKKYGKNKARIMR